MTRDDFKPLADFVKEHYEPASEWGDKLLLDYICWAADNDFLFIARGDDGSIHGAALARTVAQVPVESDTEFDVAGKIIFVDCMVADSRKFFQLLGWTILESFKSCHTVMFQRLQRGDKIKAYPAKKVRNTLFKLRN